MNFKIRSPELIFTKYIQDISTKYIQGDSNSVSKLSLYLTSKVFYLQIDYSKIIYSLNNDIYTLFHKFYH